MRLFALAGERDISQEVAPAAAVVIRVLAVSVVRNTLSRLGLPRLPKRSTGQSLAAAWVASAGDGLVATGCPTFLSSG